MQQHNKNTCWFHQPAGVVQLRIKMLREPFDLHTSLPVPRVQLTLLGSSPHLPTKMGCWRSCSSAAMLRLPLLAIAALRPEADDISG